MNGVENRLTEFYNQTNENFNEACQSSFTSIERIHKVYCFNI